MQVNERVSARQLAAALRVVGAPDLGALPARNQDALWKAMRSAMGLPPVAIDDLGIQFVGLPEAEADFREKWRARNVALMAQAQRAARGLVEAAAAGQPVRFVLRGARAETIIDESGLSFRGELNQTFPITVAWLLFHSQAGQRVRKCPECGTLFIRVRRQLCCSASCTNKAQWKKYPLAKKLAARRKYYDEMGWTMGARSKGGKKR